MTPLGPLDCSPGRAGSQTRDWWIMPDGSRAKPPDRSLVSARHLEFVRLLISDCRGRRPRRPIPVGTPLPGCPGTRSGIGDTSGEVSLHCFDITLCVWIWGCRGRRPRRPISVGTPLPGCPGTRPGIAGILSVGAIIDRPPKNIVFRISRREITLSSPCGDGFSSKIRGRVVTRPTAIFRRNKGRPVGGPSACQKSANFKS